MFKPNEMNLTQMKKKMNLMIRSRVFVCISPTGVTTFYCYLNKATDLVENFAPNTRKRFYLNNKVSRPGDSVYKIWSTRATVDQK